MGGSWVTTYTCIHGQCTVDTCGIYVHIVTWIYVLCARYNTIFTLSLRQNCVLKVFELCAVPLPQHYYLIYIYISVCVCVCVYNMGNAVRHGRNNENLSIPCLVVPIYTSQRRGIAFLFLDRAVFFSVPYTLSCPSSKLFPSETWLQYRDELARARVYVCVLSRRLYTEYNIIYARRSNEINRKRR